MTNSNYFKQYLSGHNFLPVKWVSLGFMKFMHYIVHWNAGKVDFETEFLSVHPGKTVGMWSENIKGLTEWLSHDARPEEALVSSIESSKSPKVPQSSSKLGCHGQALTLHWPTMGFFRTGCNFEQSGFMGGTLPWGLAVKAPG